MDGRDLFATISVYVLNWRRKKSYEGLIATT